MIDRNPFGLALVIVAYELAPVAQVLGGLPDAMSAAAKMTELPCQRTLGHRVSRVEYAHPCFEQGAGEER